MPKINENQESFNFIEEKSQILVKVLNNADELLYPNDLNHSNDSDETNENIVCMILRSFLRGN